MSCPHYADLRQLLYDTAVSLGADIRLNTPVASIDPDNQSVTLQSGQILTADVIVGADGVHGLARGLITDEPPAPHQFVMYSTTISKKAIMADRDLRWLYDQPYVRHDLLLFFRYLCLDISNTTEIYVLMVW
ncbi:hypothetical protein C0992_013069 [Termitomyces sp. T32_za158]|nr:hypothetical protein C0992_013069 [Termitomyces sp. T32_za158]